MRKLLVATLLLALSAIYQTPLRAEAFVVSESAITTVAGSISGFAGDGGPAGQALLYEPRDSDIGPDGSIYLSDTGNHRIRKIAPDGTITTIAGTGSPTYNGDDIPASRASLAMPHDVAVGDDGVLYVADTAHQRIRRIGTDGVISTIAGTGIAGSSGDGGPATSAQLKGPKSVVLHAGGLYLSGVDHKIRRVDLGTGIITTVAGTGVAGYSGDGGPATQATMREPQRVQIDSQGTIYVAEKGNSVVRRIDAVTGTISTVVGTGVAGSSGEGGPATQARLNQPRGIALEGDSTLYVADTNNHQVRRVDLATGTINLVAGSMRGFGGDGGPAGRAKLCLPRGLTAMPDGDLLVADTCNNRLRRIDTEVVVTPEPDPPVELFTNSSVESSGTGYTGTATANDQVTWTDEGGWDGTHSMRIANLATSAQDAGLTNKPLTVTQTTSGHTYSGSVWVRSTQPNQTVVLRLRECSTTCYTQVATVTLGDTGWRRINNVYIARTDGGALNYAVVARALPAGALVYADMFSMTRQTPR